MGKSPGLVRDLVHLLGDGKVSTEQEELERFSSDALNSYRAFRAAPLLEQARPDVVVRLDSTEEVARLLRYASAQQVPVIPVGGNTGVMGGAVPIRGGITLDLRGLDRIVAVDPEARTVTVEAGVILEELEQALNRQGLMLGHDPWSLPIATVGGAIATNGVGCRAGKYGPMGAQVRGLEAVLPTGEVIQTRGVPKHTGPSLDSLFIGTEGTLGVITRATLEVFPTPERRILAAYEFESFEAGFAAVMGMFAIGLQPAMVDFSEEPGNGEDVELYLCFEGPREEAEAQAQRAAAICREAEGEAMEQQVAQHFWETRHALGELYRRQIQGNAARGSPTRRFRWRMDYLHVTLPASRVLEYRSQAWALLRERGIPVHEWSIWGRPEFFSLLIVDPSPAPDGEWGLVARTVDDLLSLAQDMGGAMEYCHGVGIKLAHLMERELGGGLELLRQIKAAVDPTGILNPGKLGL